MQPINTISVCAILIFHSGLSAQTNYHQFIDPFIGSEGPGNVFIGPSTPFGMAKPGPDVQLSSQRQTGQPSIDTVFKILPKMP